MEMAQFDDWLDGINTHIATSTGGAANIPRLVVVHTVRSVVRQFLTESKCWVYKPRFINQNARSRVTTIPRDTYICKVWSDRCSPCISESISFSHPNIINLNGISDNELNNITLKDIEVSLSVTQTSLECPMFIFDKYYDGILSGALAGLQAMPGKSWSQPSMVAYHKDVFDATVMSAKNDVTNGFNRKKSSPTIPANFT